MELKETAALMDIDDYQDRFRAEYYQTVIRYGKLMGMLEKWDKGELGFVPDCPREIYNIQAKAMADYIAVLHVRARMECIEV